MSIIYDPQLLHLVNSFSNESLAEFLRGRCGAFVAEGIDYSDVVVAQKCTELQQIGVIKYANVEKLQIITCKYDGELSQRVAKKAQFDQIKKILGDEYNDAAVFVFYDNEGRFRFSFVRKNWGAKGDGKYTPWKRYTFFVDRTAQSNRTFLERIGGCRFGSIKEVQEAFAVEPLSDAFFDEYKRQYSEFCGYLTGKYWVKGRGNTWSETNYRDHEPDLVQFYAQFGGDAKRVRDYIKKLLGRLVFLKFLERKRWLNKQYDFLTQLFDRSDHQEDFLDGVLEPLFFKILNTPVEKRELAELTPIFGEGFDIPYLNGGLFDNDTADDMRVRFPRGHFEKVFEFFDRYNFTIDENDPNDAEVGIDPEMLGRIFENLLEDNKDKGAFYTPKEIVQYMCQESLIQYLQTHLGESEDLADFVRTGEIKGVVRKHAPRIDELLDGVKICDPAVGSGAFPMGLLQEILRAKVELNLADSDKITEFKEHIIQNSIYGVDIEQGAVDIARLRFWLSLVVDSEVAKPLPNLDYKIMCGNSLISRYGLDMPLDDVFAEYNRDRVEADRMTLEKYRALVSQYTDEHGDKRGLRVKIEEIKRSVKAVLYVRDTHGINAKRKRLSVLEHPTLFGETQSREDKAEIKRLRDEIKALERGQQDVLANKVYENAFEWRFEFPSLLDDDGKFIGFDIVIGNPPYVSFGLRGVGKMDEAEKSLLRAKYPNSAEYKISYYALFMELAINITAFRGIHTYIVPDSYLLGMYFSKIRRYILNQCRIISHNLFTYKVFGSATVGYSLICFYQKQLSQNNLCECAIINSKKELIENKFKRHLLSQSYYEKLLLNRFRLIFSQQDYDIIQKIESNTKPLGQYFKGRTGIRSKIGQKNIVSKEQETPLYKRGIISSSQVDNYIVSYECDWINVDPTLLNAGGFDQEIMKNPKLFIPQTGDKIKAAIDKRGLYHLNNVHSFAPINSLISIEVVAAILNSTLLRWYYQTISLEANRAMAQVDIETVELFPIKQIGNDEQHHIAELVNNLIENKTQERDIEELENELNSLIYDLYDLTPEEITRIEK